MSSHYNHPYQPAQNITLPACRQLINEVCIIERFCKRQPKEVYTKLDTRYAPPPLQVRPDHYPPQKYSEHPKPAAPIQAPTPMHPVATRGRHNHPGYVISQPRSEMLPSSNGFSPTPQFRHYPAQVQQVPAGHGMSDSSGSTSSAPPNNKVPIQQQCSPGCVIFNIDKVQHVLQEFGAGQGSSAHQGKAFSFTPLPSADIPHIMFEPRDLSGLVGVSLAELRKFGNCLKAPADWVLANLRVGSINFVLQFDGYKPVTKKIRISCNCGSITRYKLALEIADILHRFFKNESFDAITSIGSRKIIRSIANLRLMSMYTTDGGVNWRVQLATVFDK